MEQNRESRDVLQRYMHTVFDKGGKACSGENTAYSTNGADKTAYLSA